MVSGQSEQNDALASCERRLRPSSGHPAYERSPPARRRGVPAAADEVPRALRRSRGNRAHAPGHTDTARRAVRFRAPDAGPCRGRAGPEPGVWSTVGSAGSLSTGCSSSIAAGGAPGPEPAGSYSTIRTRWRAGSGARPWTRCLPGGCAFLDRTPTVCPRSTPRPAPPLWKHVAAYADEEAGSARTMCELTLPAAPLIAVDHSLPDPRSRARWSTSPAPSPWLGYLAAAPGACAPQGDNFAGFTASPDHLSAHGRTPRLGRRPVPADLLRRPGGGPRNAGAGPARLRGSVRAGTLTQAPGTTEA